MDEQIKFDKLNTKIDSLKEDLFELKSDIKLFVQKFEVHSDDDKELAKKFLPIYEEYIYEKESKKRIVELAKKFGLFSIILGVIYKILRLLSIF